ncbi:hypothetical protein TNCV_1402611 [Trichonephila clavipes]|nr:hypothetical protein TNCV_1402611 [Trichonephila clavipes]
MAPEPMILNENDSHVAICANSSSGLTHQCSKKVGGLNSSDKAKLADTALLVDLKPTKGRNVPYTGPFIREDNRYDNCNDGSQKPILMVEEPEEKRAVA